MQRAAISESSLSPRRMLALREYLRNGGNLTLTAKCVNVSRQSIKKWSQSKPWRDAEAKALASILPAPKKVRPRKLFQRALSRLEHDLLHGNEESKTASARLIFSRLSNVMVAEDAERRIAELSQRLTQLQGIVENRKANSTTKKITTKINSNNFEFDDE